MLHKKVNSFLWHFSNFTTPSSTPGTSVTPGASNAEGSWVQIASSANIAYDVFLLYLAVGGGNTSSAAKNHLLDIGVDPAGGTSYAPLISNIVCGQSQAVTTGWDEFIFPICIKAGSSVAVRVQGSNATAGTVRVVGDFFGRPTNPELVPVGQWAETIGTITNSNGTSITPGNAAEGSWVSLGTTTKDLWHWQIGAQVDNGTIAAQYATIDLAYGDATNKEIILEDVAIGFYGTAEIKARTLNGRALCRAQRYVPAGSTIYARARCSTSPATGYNVTAIGIGG
jgi:hypothetical protein